MNERLEKICKDCVVKPTCQTACDKFERVVHNIFQGKNRTQLTYYSTSNKILSGHYCITKEGNLITHRLEKNYKV